MPYPPQPFAFGYYFAFEGSKGGGGGEKGPDPALHKKILKNLCIT